MVFVLFNRPETTRRTFAAIRAARPARLWLVADGPRERPGEAARVSAARDAVEKVGWTCQVRRLYAQKNLGCRRRVVSALDEVFAQEERAIVVEDDCLATPRLFDFCEQLLERYADDERVLSVGGNNLLFGRRGAASYHFSRLFDCWGWATWRRAWQGHDAELSGWPAFRGSGALDRLFPDPRSRRFWTRTFDAVHARQLDSWALAFLFSALARGGLHAVSAVNLVSNIGFGPEGGTHLRGLDLLDRVPTAPLEEDLVHPPVQADDEADELIQRVFFERRRRDRLRAAVRRVAYELRGGEAVYLRAIARALLRRPPRQE